MRKIITLVSVLIIYSINSRAQKWVEMMHDPKANFYDIVKEFDNYWKDRPYERGHGYQVFKRWQCFMEPRVYPSGDLKLGSQAYALEQYQKFLNENNTSKLSSNAAITATTANWVPLGPFGSPAGTAGEAGRVQVIKMHPANTNTFYVGVAAGGFWMTNNGGVSYTTTTDQLSSCGVSDIAICTQSPNIIYISTGDKDGSDTPALGVLKSTDGGQTWNTTGLIWQASQQRKIHRLLINPQNPNTLIVASTAGMYQSWDAGLTWSLTSNGTYVDAEYCPSDTTIVHVVTNGSYLKSTSGGLSYSTPGPAYNSNRLSLAVTPANNNYVYILASSPSNGFGGLYLSTNAGNTFSLMSSTPNIFQWTSDGSGSGGQGWYDIAIDASPTNANEITAGGVNTWKSINAGSTWSINTIYTPTTTSTPYVHADVHCILYTSGTTCFLGTDGGIAKTTNSGTNWSVLNGNMNIAQIYKIGLSASNPSLIIAGHQDNGTNILSSTTWSSVIFGDGMDCFVDWSNNNVMVASKQVGGYSVTTNGGTSWADITSGLIGTGAWVAPIVQSPSNPNTYYCGYQNVFKSTNQGASWTQMGTIGSTLDEIKISPSNTNIIYATSFGAIYKTINGGINWTNITGTIPVTSAAITDLAIDNTNPNKIYITLSGYSAGNKVYASYDGGISWANYSTGLPNIPVNCIIYANNSPQQTYIGTALGVYYREASMANWIPYNSGLPNVIIDDMEIYYPTGKLRAATFARGVWETDLYTNPTTSPVAAFGTQFSMGCIGLPLQFNDYSGNNPTVWNWTFTGGSPTTSTLQNPSITYSSAGIYTVTLVSANPNGTSTPYTSTISVVNAPTVAPSSNTACIDVNAKITAITNGNNVIWSTGQQGFTITLKANIPTVYTYTSSLGACSTVGSSTLNVIPIPPIPTIISIGNYLTTTVVAQSYQWYLNSVAIPGETSQTFTPIVSGTYNIYIVDGSCNGYSSDFTITDIGLKELSELSGLTIGPNPAKDYLSISLKTGNNEDIIYEIQNNLGQIIAKSKLKFDGDKKTKLNIQFLSSGIYYLNLKKGENKSFYKFIKE